MELSVLADAYRAAIGARDAHALPLAASVRYTENGYEVPLDKGVWSVAMETPADYLTVTDPLQEQVVLLGILTAGQGRFLYASRLRREAGLVTEIETLVVTKRSEMSVRGLENLIASGGPRPVISQVVPPERRVSRERLAKIAHLYFDAIETNDGTIFPGAPGCVRLENGVQTAPRTEEARRMMVEDWGFPDFGELDVKGDLSTGVYRHITAIRDRRIIAVDEERQIAISAIVFDHHGDVRTLPELGIDVTRPIMRTPFSLLAFELFKAEDGEAVAIEAVGLVVPLGASLGWPVDPVRGSMAA